MRYEVTYQMHPADNIVAIFEAMSEEEACRYAKQYRNEAFTIKKINKKLFEYCNDCRYAIFEPYNDEDRFSGDVLTDCRKGLEPVYNEQEECTECEGYKPIPYEE